MLKGTKLYSIFKNRCPRCHKGRFWKAKNPWKNILKKENLIDENCAYCELKYEREIGFWYGAMYVSYALAVAIFVAGWVATSVLLPIFDSGETNLLWQIAIIVSMVILFAPYNWWLSRLIWINLFVKYNKEKVN